MLGVYVNATKCRWEAQMLFDLVYRHDTKTLTEFAMTGNEYDLIMA